MISLHKDIMEASSREGKLLFQINGKLGTRTSTDRIVKHKFKLETGRNCKNQRREVIPLNHSVRTQEQISTRTDKYFRKEFCNVCDLPILETTSLSIMKVFF